MGQKRFSDAIHAYKEALRVKPRARKTYKFLGIAYASLGNSRKACQNYKKYVKYMPKAKDAEQVRALIKSCE